MKRKTLSYLWLVAALAGTMGLQGCPRPDPKSGVDYKDDPETPMEAKQGTACQRAAKRLSDLKCKDAAPDFAVLCEKLVKEGKLPVCPTKLARIKSCDEVETICR